MNQSESMPIQYQCSSATLHVLDPINHQIRSGYRRPTVFYKGTFK